MKVRSRPSTRADHLLRLVTVVVAGFGLLVMHGLTSSASGSCADMAMSGPMLTHPAPAAVGMSTLPAAGQHHTSCTPAPPRRASLAWLVGLLALGAGLLRLGDRPVTPWRRLRHAGLPPPRRGLLTKLCVSLT